MALTKLRGNIVSTGTITNAKIEDGSITFAKLKTTPATTGKAIAMAIVFG